MRAEQALRMRSAQDAKLCASLRHDAIPEALRMKCARKINPSILQKIAKQCDRIRRNARIPSAGFEPATCGLEVRSGKNKSSTQPIYNTNTYNQTKKFDPSVLASSLALLIKNHPDLTSLIKAWPTLSEPIRRGILAMVQAVQG